MYQLRPLGQAPAAIRTQIIVQQGARLSARTRLELIVALGAGVMSVISLLMFATGREKLGYMLGIGTALGGAMIAAAQLIGMEEGQS